MQLGFCISHIKFRALASQTIKVDKQEWLAPHIFQVSHAPAPPTCEPQFYLFLCIGNVSATAYREHNHVNVKTVSVTIRDERHSGTNGDHYTGMHVIQCCASTHTRNVDTRTRNYAREENNEHETRTQAQNTKTRASKQAREAYTKDRDTRTWIQTPNTTLKKMFDSLQ